MATRVYPGVGWGPSFRSGGRSADRVQVGEGIDGRADDRVAVRALPQRRGERVRMPLEVVMGDPSESVSAVADVSDDVAGGHGSQMADARHMGVVRVPQR